MARKPKDIVNLTFSYHPLVILGNEYRVERLSWRGAFCFPPAEREYENEKD
jgi:hypothetical protein